MTEQKKTALVTGASDGIGLEIAALLAERGHRVLIHGRNPAKLEAAAAALRSRTGAEIIPFVADFSDLKAVRRLAEEVSAAAPKLDLLVNNAGLMTFKGSLSAQKHEIHFAVNHLAPFALTRALSEPLKAVEEPVVINVSSAMYKRGYLNLKYVDKIEGYDALAAYSRSKLCNVLFSRSLIYGKMGFRVRTYAAHPGLVNTGLIRDLSGFFARAFDTVKKAFFISAAAGARNVIGPYLDGKVGWGREVYFEGQKARELTGQAQDTDLADVLWEYSERVRT